MVAINDKPMSKLDQLFSLCQEVILFYNGHKGTSETVDEYIQDWGKGDQGNAIRMEIYAEMVRLDRVIVIQLYSPYSTDFQLVFHYDLEKATEQALALFTS